MRYLILSLFLLTSSSAHAQVVECNGTWTNQPCESEASAKFEEVSRQLSQEERERIDKSYITGKMEVDYRGYGFNPDSFINDCKTQNLSDCRKTYHQLRARYNMHARAEEEKVAKAKRAEALEERKKQEELRRDLSLATSLLNATRSQCSAR